MVVALRRFRFKPKQVKSGVFAPQMWLARNYANSRAISFDLAIVEPLCQLPKRPRTTAVYVKAKFKKPSLGFVTQSMDGWPVRVFHTRPFDWLVSSAACSQAAELGSRRQKSAGPASRAIVALA
jgi:hypothetical protein